MDDRDAKVRDRAQQWLGRRSSILAPGMRPPQLPAAGSAVLRTAANSTPEAGWVRLRHDLIALESEAVAPVESPSPAARDLRAFDAALEHLRLDEQCALFLRIELQLPDEEVCAWMHTPTVGAGRMMVCRALTRVACEMAR